MPAQPDWSSPLGRAVRRAEIPDCGCKPKLLHEADCPYQGAATGSPCDCRYAFRGGACAHVAAHDPDLTFDELRQLLTAFDPAGHAEPPAPAEAAVAEDAEALLALRIARAAGQTGLRHPQDVLPGDDRLKLAVQAKSGLRQDGTRTPRLTHLERTLLAKLEEVIEPAFLTWPWTRAGLDRLPAAARALAEMRDRQLYREAATSFAGYALARWEFLPCDLDRLFAAAAPATDSPATIPFPRAA